MKAFFAGVGLGAAVGILFAPQDGKKTGAMLANRAGHLLEQFRKRAQAKAEPADEIPESEVVAEVLNTAGKHELMSVPGIGKGTAKKIIEHRPYETKEEIVQEGILPEEILERVEEQLIDKSRDIA